MEQYEIPLGFGMALAQNPKAMEKFSALNNSRKQEILNQTHSVKSKAEMQKIVNKLASL